MHHKEMKAVVKRTALTSHTRMDFKKKNTKLDCGSETERQTEKKNIGKEGKGIPLRKPEKKSKIINHSYPPPELLWVFIWLFVFFFFSV